MGNSTGNSRGKSKLTIRHYREEDRPAVREICCRTAFRNRGCDLFFEDRELFADYWTNYYLEYEPGLCFIAEMDGKIVGYLLGSADYKHFERAMKKKILPAIFLKVLGRALTFRYRRKITYRYLRWGIFESWREMPPIPFERFPAHYHSNILREGAFQHGFSRLLLRYLDELEKRGVPGMHGIVLEPADGGWMTKLLAKARDRQIGKEEFFAERPTSLFRIVLKDSAPMVNRVYGCSIETYRKFVSYVNTYYRL
ncbi:MAG: hypothetical protein KAT34_19700 [Candidatus Aminicenantes bacterium]|nr:hypothetical protein [Candidatus Aminicenantes bacterium]